MKYSRTVALAVLFGFGCGSQGGGGCGSLRPLPSANGVPQPPPFGIPSGQLIEGGMQARITKPGVDKILKAVTDLVSNNFKNGICAVQPTDQHFGITCFNVDVGACHGNGCPGGKPGCPAQLELTSADGYDRITISLSDGPNPLVHLDAKFDMRVPLELDYGGELFCFGGSGSCILDIQSDHWMKNMSGMPLEIVGDIATGIDASTGELTLNLADLSLQNLNLNISGCGVLGDILNAVVQFFNNQVGIAVTNFVINQLKPQINMFLQALLPKPPGVAGVIDTGALLHSFGAPKGAGLESFIVAGGYVAGKGGGLNIGVMSGMNSDRDETTRTPDLVSEPALCVPPRQVPQLTAAPWMLPYNTARRDFLLSPVPELNGTPDPVDANGNTQDIAIGLSRTFLDLVGFHVYNSGTLCLEIGGAAIPQLSAGTLSLLVGSLGNVIEDKKAPLMLELRPQTPLTFQIGAGNMNDPLLKIAISDLRIDFYGWIEERYARLFTLGLDVNVGLNLTIEKDATGKPAVAPTFVGLDAKNVTIRVSNTDLLQEPPASLASLFPSLIGVAVGAIGSAIKPITLPAVAGFGLDGLRVQKLHTSQDDFVAIYGNIVTGLASLPWFTPESMLRVEPQAVVAQARVAALTVPSADELQALFLQKRPRAQRPSVTLALTASQPNGRPVEYAWRIDGGMWRPWVQDANPTITADELLLQGRHKIEVRSRVVDDWSTQSEPVALDVLIDSVPPELHPARDSNDRELIRFGGFDIVSDTAKLLYAWRDGNGARTAWQSDGSMSHADALRLTDDGRRPLTLYAVDEAGNVGSRTLTLQDLGFAAPPPSSSGCSITGTSPSPAPFFVLVLAFVPVLARRRVRAAAHLVLCAGVGLVTGCHSKASCKVDDDCAAMTCPAGQVATCSGSCGCVPDNGLGDIGRFSSMTPIGDTAYVSAYNNTWGDLMIGRVKAPGVVGAWDFVDGVPDVAPDLPRSHVRGGITDKGDDVGRYTSIATSQTNEPIVAYYDVTHGALKFASFGVIRWHTHFVDGGPGASSASAGDTVGKWTSMTVGPDGKPGIAYSAWVQKGRTGTPEQQLRWAQAKTATPTQASDWLITVVDARAIPQAGPPNDMGVGAPPDFGTETPGPLVDGIALMASAARKADGSPGIAYYDRTRGNLRFVEWAGTHFGTPVILDGEKPDGSDTGDVGLYCSLVYDSKGTAHIAYENDASDTLYYFNTLTSTPEVVDDGYHPKDEHTQDGIDSPLWHLVGDSSSIQLSTAGRVAIAYQDSTVLTLRLATRDVNGAWKKQDIAGHANPFKGSYGFYADLKVAGAAGMLSSYAINQQLNIPSFYVEVFALDMSQIP